MLFCGSQLDKALQDYNRMREREAAAERESADAAAAAAGRKASGGSRRKSALPVRAYERAKMHHLARTSKRDQKVICVHYMSGCVVPTTCPGCVFASMMFTRQFL